MRGAGARNPGCPAEPGGSRTDARARRGTRAAEPTTRRRARAARRDPARRGARDRGVPTGRAEGWVRPSEARSRGRTGAAPSSRNDPAMDAIFAIIAARLLYCVLIPACGARAPRRAARESQCSEDGRGLEDGLRRVGTRGTMTVKLKVRGRCCDWGGATTSPEEHGCTSASRVRVGSASRSARASRPLSSDGTCHAIGVSSSRHSRFCLILAFAGCTNRRGDFPTFSGPKSCSTRHWLHPARPAPGRRSACRRRRGSPRRCSSRAGPRARPRTPRAANPSRKPLARSRWRARRRWPPCSFPARKCFSRTAWNLM